MSEPPDKQQSSSASNETPNATSGAAAVAPPAPPKRLGSTTRGRATTMPRFAGRRSAQSRAELEEAARQRRAEEKASAEKAKKSGRGGRGAERGGRGTERGAGRGRGRGRGGFMGEQLLASGPFGSGLASKEDVKYRPSQGSRAGSSVTNRYDASADPSGPLGSGLSSNTRSSGSKSASGVKSEHGGRGLFQTPMDIKREDGGYISTDDEEAEDGKTRVDIDRLQTQHIDLTADDDLQESMAPVRLMRYPHRDRKQTTRMATDTGQSGNSVSDSVTSDKKKRTKDVEITGSSRAPTRQEVFSSSSETEAEPTIKAEPTEEDAVLNIPEQAPLQMETDPQGPPSSPETKRKAKEAIKESATTYDPDDDHEFKPDPKPTLRTAPEELEWQILMEDRRALFEELGRQVPKTYTAPTDPEAEIPAHIRKAQQAQETRNSNCYLFQFPSVLPVLVPESEQAEDTSMPDANAPAPAAPTQPAYPPPGYLGKLRIHQSGRATLDYGGILMDVSSGIPKHFSESILLMNLPKTKPPEDEDTGEDHIKKEEPESSSAPGEEEQTATAHCMGTVRGQFVVTPNLDELLKNA